MREIRVQVQSILFHNDQRAIKRAVEHVANAAAYVMKNETAFGGTAKLTQVTYKHGDASAVPVFTPAEYAAMSKKYESFLVMQQILFGENTGHSGGQNRLAQDCSSDFIMILNPDVLVNPHIFEQLLKPFLMLGGEQIGITEARQTPIEHHKAFDPDTGETEWTAGACIMFPTSVYQDVGCFDHASFFMYCDDVDFSWRVRLAGYRLLYIPEAAVFHSKHITSKGAWMPTSAEQYFSAEAALIMAHKWSHLEKLKETLELFDSSNDASQLKAAQEFRRREKEGLLPTPLDADHLVASFTPHGYGKYRFIY